MMHFHDCEGKEILPHHLLWTPGNPLFELVKEDIPMSSYVLLIDSISFPLPTTSYLLQHNHQDRDGSFHV
ncbi:hypothetical protein E2C01_010138 [Portunus trituberculatus]|uniref:Uncharacterized protein n=1 Tax=Portunus trituberculatus TaxID=210409 RepID=A0A5B7D7K9_PORTR|nr:hypothetical protein [Portunus trituberculatus]